MNKYLSVIFLYSGQYALFYIFMNLSLGKEHFLNDLGLIVLVCALLFQILVSTFVIKEAYAKALATFIAPAFYTLYDSIANENWIYDISHSFFWIFTTIVATFIIIEKRSNNKILKIISESFITFLNVFVFIFLFFYFTLLVEQKELLLHGMVTQTQYILNLQIHNIITGFIKFLEDPTHLYITFGGFFLASTITYNRIENILLTNKIENIVDTYLDTSVKERLLDEKIIGEKKDLVIMFSDLRNFTKLSDKFEPTKVVKTLDLYYTFWDNITKANNGVINKFIGDAVLITFGLDNEKDSTTNVDNAIKSAIKMRKSFEKLNNTLKEKGLPLIDEMGIGIHYGSVILGSIGSQNRKDYTVIGDNVNIASKLESMCKIHHNKIIISHEVYQQTELKDKFEFIDNFQFKGKQNFTSIYGLKE